MIDNKYLQLISKIKDKTQKGLVEWYPGNYSNTYSTNIGKGSVTISLEEDIENLPDDAPIAYITFSNERGETFASENYYNTEELYYANIEELFHLAKRSYMLIDDTLKSMFDDLDSRI